MLLIDGIEVRQSAIHGLGIFTTKAIPAGTPVSGWRADKDFKLTPYEWAILPENLRKLLYVYCWVGPDGDWYGSHDISRYTNHLDAPNLAWDEETKTSKAARDIAAGEELTENYMQFDGVFSEYADEIRKESVVPRELAVDGMKPQPDTELWGKATLIRRISDDSGKYQSYANVGGQLMIVELTITINRTA